MIVPNQGRNDDGKEVNIYLTYDERRMLINSLIDKKNELLSIGHYTDAIDEILIKVMNAKIKKARVKEV